MLSLLLASCTFSVRSASEERDGLLYSYRLTLILGARRNSPSRELPICASLNQIKRFRSAASERVQPGWPPPRWPLSTDTYLCPSGWQSAEKRPLNRDRLPLTGDGTARSRLFGRCTLWGWTTILCTGCRRWIFRRDNYNTEVDKGMTLHIVLCFILMKSGRNSFLEYDHTVQDQGAKPWRAMTTPCPSARTLPEEASLSG